MRGKFTMKMWCDFDPTLEDASEYENLPEVQEMPCYPDTGSYSYDGRGADSEILMISC